MAAAHNGIEVAVFDIGNVIFRLNKNMRWLSGLLNVPEEQVRKSWLAVDDRACRGKMEVQEVWNYLASQYGYTGAPIYFLRSWAENFEPIEETHQLIKELSCNMAVGLLTNVYSGGYQAGIDNGSIPKLDYKFVTQSCLVGSVKPEAAIYEAAESASGVKPEQLLLIDDLVPNIDMAKARGWRAIRFNPNEPSDSVMQVRNMLA